MRYCTISVKGPRCNFFCKQRVSGTGKSAGDSAAAGAETGYGVRARTWYTEMKPLRNPARAVRM